MIATLAQKYGEPSSKGEGFAGARYFSWVYRNGAKVPCSQRSSDPSYCNLGQSTKYIPQDLDKYVHWGENHGGVIVFVELKPWYEDKTKLKDFAISIVDVTKKGQAAKADIDSLYEEAERQHSAKSQKVSVPKL